MLPFQCQLFPSTRCGFLATRQTLALCVLRWRYTLPEMFFTHSRVHIACSLSSFMCSLKYNFLREAFCDHLISYCICRPLSYVPYSSIFSPKQFLCSFADISPFCTLSSNLNEMSRKARVFLQAISRSSR